MSDNHFQFIEFALKANVLRFGEFKTKAGRLSPYFFNAGLFNTGSLLDQLGHYYATALLNAKKAGRIDFDMLYGPAYKGIPSISPGWGLMSLMPLTVRKPRITAKAAPSSALP